MSINKSEILLKNGFKGFGRIGELSVFLIKHQDMIDLFFEKLIGSHANNPLLTFSSYQKSKWFLLKKNTIGIDKFKESYSYISCSLLILLFHERL